MNIKKSMISVLSALFILFALVGCGTSNSSFEPKKVVNGSETGGIVAGQFTPELKKEMYDGKLVYHFTIKNDMEKEEVLHYTSSQTYDYQLIDHSGNVVYTYSMDKSFLQAISEKTLKPGEMIQFDIDLSEDLKKLKPGTYRIEVWSTAKDSSDLKAKSEFNWDGTDDGLEEGNGSKLAGATVIYIGLMDNNSIEVMNENGEHDHYRLSEKVKSKFETLEKDTQITIHYGYTEDGQKIIEEVIK